MSLPSILREKYFRRCFFFWSVSPSSAVLVWFFFFFPLMSGGRPLIPLPIFFFCREARLSMRFLSDVFHFVPRLPLVDAFPFEDQTNAASVVPLPLFERSPVRPNAYKLSAFVGSVTRLLFSLSPSPAPFLDVTKECSARIRSHRFPRVVSSILSFAFFLCSPDGCRRLSFDVRLFNSAGRVFFSVAFPPPFFGVFLSFCLRSQYPD